MNQQDKIELSMRVAKKCGIEASVSNTYEDRYLENGHYQYEEVTNTTWLADDDARCFRLAVDNKLNIINHNKLIVEVFNLTGDFVTTAEDYADHNDRYEATRIAILRCLDTMKG